MSHLVPENFVQQYSSNVALLAQQGTSRLRDKVTTKELKGIKGSVDAILPTRPFRRRGRHSDTKLVNTEHQRRWYRAHTYDWADLVDDEDKLKTLYDPTHPYAVNAGKAFARQKDDEIINAFFADVEFGVEGGQWKSWETDAANRILPANATLTGASGDATGLTLEKLMLMNEIFNASDLEDDETRYIGVSAKQITDLLNEDKLTNTDYATVKALVNGEVNQFMGFTFVRSERFLYAADGNRRLPVWTKSGMGICEPKGVTTDIGPRRDKNNSTQIFVTMTLGAVRLDEKRVGEILVKE